MLGYEKQDSLLTSCAVRIFGQDTRIVYHCYQDALTFHQDYIIMELEKTIELLHRVPLFNGLAYEHLSLLAFSSERLLFHKGEALAQVGQPGNAAYLILMGRADVMEGETMSKTQLTLTKGSLVGELAMLIDYQFSHTILATDELEVLQLSRETVQNLMVQFPDIAEHFSDKIHQRLTHMSDQQIKAV